VREREKQHTHQQEIITQRRWIIEETREKVDMMKRSPLLWAGKRSDAASSEDAFIIGTILILLFLGDTQSISEKEIYWNKDSC
jgi:hypothetical protein